jgi:hypothetical protein
MKSVVQIYLNTGLVMRRLLTARIPAAWTENLNNLVKKIGIMGPQLSLRNETNFVPSCI